MSSVRVLKADLVETVDLVEQDETDDAELADAFEAGRRAGYAEGVAAESSRSDQELRSSLDSWAASAQDAASAVHRLDTEVIVDTAIDLALWICRDALSIPAGFRERVAELLSVGDAVPTTVRVAPSHAPFITDAVPDTCSVVADAALDVGDIVVESDSTSTRLLLIEAVERVRPVLSSALRDGERGS